MTREQVDKIHVYTACVFIKAPCKTAACFLILPSQFPNTWSEYLTRAFPPMRQCCSIKADECIVCGCSNSKLSQCRDISSWTTLYRAAVIHNHKTVLKASTESEFTKNPIKYHRNRRAEFTNNRDLQVANKPSDDKATGTAPERSSRDGNPPSSAVLPDQCLFCKNWKYKANTKTREKLHSVQKFRTDETVKTCASLHIQQKVK